MSHSELHGSSYPGSFGTERDQNSVRGRILQGGKKPILELLRSLSFPPASGLGVSHTEKARYGAIR